MSADLGSLSDSPTATPRSSAGFFLRRQSLVPKLHLPVPVTPAPNSCSRLSVQSTAQAMQHNTSSRYWHHLVLFHTVVSAKQQVWVLEPCTLMVCILWQAALCVSELLSTAVQTFHRGVLFLLMLCSFSSTDRAAGAEQKAAAPSYLRALQQLGRSCGQSVMAADLAAFVTHKQLLGGVVALESTLQHSRHPATSSQQGRQCNFTLAVTELV